MSRILWNNCLIVWTIIACLSTKITYADVLQYGTRIRPPSSTFNPKEQKSATYVSSTSNSRVQNTLEVDSINSAINLEESTDANPLVKDSNAKLRNLFYTSKPLVKIQQTASPTFSEVPKDNPKRGATFFFTQVEPHRFEYRAMFQHQRNIHSDVFQPFVHDFDSFSKGFPPLPKLSAFPELPNFFPEHKDPFPNINEFSFPTLPPSIKRIWQTSREEIPERPLLEEKIENPLGKEYDVLLGPTSFPKIFRFNEERVNIEGFDREKKLRFYNLNKREQNDLLEPENVKREQLLILHGGVFTVQEPPIFKKPPIKKRRKQSNYGFYRLRA